MQVPALMQIGSYMQHTLSLIALVAALPAGAQHMREAGSHEHGVGALNIAIDAETVAMAFEAPGADIVGFEYAATSQADKAAIDAAVAKLRAPLDLFVMPADAACSIVAVRAALELEEATHKAHDNQDHGHDGHEGHDHTGDDHTGDEHDHEDHADEGREEEGHGEEGHGDEGHAERDDHGGDAGHTEFHAQYELNCADTDALTSITFAYFEAFPNAQKVDVQILTATGARAFEVTRDAPDLDLNR